MFILHSPETDASHFSYGVIRWEKRPDYFFSRGITIFFEGCYRWSYFWGGNFPLYSTHSLGEGSFTLKSYVGGPEFLYFGLASGTFNVTESFKSLDWFGGRANFSATIPSNQDNFNVRYSLCCRFQSLKDGNNDQQTYLVTRVNLREGYSGSPVARAVPRIYLASGYLVPDLAILGYTISNTRPKFRISLNGDSGLLAMKPCGGCSSQSQYDKFTLSSAGIISWKPKESGAYAFQAQYQEARGLDSTDNYTSIDLLFDVQSSYSCTSARDCKNGNNHVPKFLQSITEYSFRTGIDTTYTISVQDNDVNELLNTSAIYLPDGANFFFIDQQGSVRNYGLRWNPNVDQKTAISCFISFDPNNNVAIGNNCSFLKVIVLDYIFVNGIVRDFKDSHPDFALTSSSSAAARGVSAPTTWVNSDLVNNKPVFKQVANAPSNFNQWFNDVAGVNLSLINTITLTDKEGHGRPLPLYSLKTDAFFPIDGKLFETGMDRRNYLFTYELHTYFTFVDGPTADTYNFKTNCDMWVFVENRLAESSTSLQKLYGHGTTASATAAKTYTLDMDALASSYSPALTRGSSYKIDIFFAQRMRGVDPIFEIEMSKSTHCNALNMLSDEVAAQAAAISHDFSNSNNLILSGLAEVSGNSGHLLGLSPMSHDSGAIWYGDVATGGGKQKVMSGFRTTFSFKTSINYSLNSLGPEGLAFVIQNHDPKARGTSGGNLGYTSLSSSVAVEFDFRSNVAQSDPSYQHISVHTAYAGKNSAIESSEFYPAGSTLTPNDPKLPMKLNNASAHDIRIDFSPSQDVTWITVYINKNIRPIFEAQLETSKLKQMWGDGAYVGFTSGSGETTGPDSGVSISNWKMSVVPPLASTTTYEITTSLNSVAGQTIYVPVQLRDYCSNPIYLSGAGARFQATAKRVGTTEPPIPLDVEDNNDGLYSFSTILTKSGDYTIQVTFQTVIGGVFEKIDGEATLTWNVKPSVLSVEKSIHYHGVLDPSVSLTTGNHGLYCATVDNRGRFLEKSGGGVDVKVYFGEDTPSLLNLKESITALSLSHSTVCAKKGKLTGLDQVQGDYLRTIFGSSDDSIVGENGSGVFVATNLNSQITFMKFSSANSPVIQKTFSVVIDADVTVDFLVSSGGVGNGAFANIQVSTTPYRGVLSSQNNLYIAALDQYENPIVALGSELRVHVTPTASITYTACEHLFDNFHVCKWSSSQTGFFTLSATGDGNVIARDASLYILSGPASHVYSIAVAEPQAIVAGASHAFSMQLRDADNQPIIVHNPDDEVTVKLVGIDNDVTVIYNSAIFDEKSRVRLFNVATGPTKTGLYNLVIFINGTQHVGTANSIVTVTPAAALASNSLVYGGVYDVITTPLPTELVVGIKSRIYVQIRDIYGNDRIAQEAGSSLVFSSSSGASYANFDIAYENSGRYAIEFFVTQTTPVTFTVEYKYSNLSVAPITILGSKPADPPGKFTINTILPGPLHVNSEFLETNDSPIVEGGMYVTTAGQERQFLVIMKDAYGNIRTGSDDIKESVVVNYSAVTYEGKLAQGTFTWDTCNNGRCVLRLSATVASGLFKSSYFYTLTIQIRSTGEHLISIINPDSEQYPAANEYTLLNDVVPASITPETTVLTDTKSQYKEGLPSSFNVIIRDMYSNRINSCPSNVVVSSIAKLDSTGAVAVDCSLCEELTAPGLYVCKFTSPVSVDASTTYEAKVKVQDTPSGSFTFDSLANIEAFHAIVKTTNLTPRLGEVLEFTIQNTDSEFTSDRQTTLVIGAKIVAANNNDPLAPVNFVSTEGLVPGSNGKYNFKFTFNYVGPFFIVPMRGGITETDVNPNDKSQRTGTFHAGAFFPPTSQITRPENTVVAGSTITWTIKPTDKNGNVFTQCQPDVKGSVYIHNLDTSPSALVRADKLKDVEGPQCTCPTSGNIMTCKFTIKKTARYDIYVLGIDESAILSSDLPVDLDPLVVISNGASYTTIVNAAPSAVTSILSDDSNGKVNSDGQTFKIYDFSSDDKKRITRYNVPLSVFVLLFDEFGNACTLKDYSSMIAVTRDNVALTSTTDGQYTLLRNGGTSNVYRSTFTFTQNAFPDFTTIQYKINGSLLTAVYDVQSGFKTYITSGPAEKVTLTSSVTKYDVDTDFTFTITLKDALDQHWVNNIITPSLDARKVEVSLRNVETGSLVYAEVTLLTTTVKAGQFSAKFSQSQLTRSGEYEVLLVTDNVVLTSKLPFATILVNHGRPMLANTILTNTNGALVTGSSGESNVFTFTLRDSKNNIITREEPYAITYGTVASTLSCGSPDFDWRILNSASDIATIVSRANFDAGLNTVVYRIAMSPRRVGTFTIGVFGPKNDFFSTRVLPSSGLPHFSPDDSKYAAHCEFNSLLTFTVVPGSASASNSIVRFVKPTTLDNPTNPQLTTGTEVIIGVQLRDTSNQNIITSEYCVTMGKSSGINADDTLVHVNCDGKDDLCKSRITAPVLNFKSRAQGYFEFKFFLSSVLTDQQLRSIPYNILFELVKYDSPQNSLNCAASTYQSLPISGENTDQLRLTVIPSDPHALRPFGESTLALVNGKPMVAGEVFTAQFMSVDQYGNKVIVDSALIQSKKYSAAVEFTRNGSISNFEGNGLKPVTTGVYKFFADMKATETGEFAATFTPFWEGEYNMNYRLYIGGNPNHVFSQSERIRVSHAKCNMRIDTRILCPDGTCVDDISKCIATVCGIDQIMCHDNTCVNSPTECSCPTDFTRCSTNNACVSDDIHCPAEIICPAETVQCESDRTQCRKNASLCPTIGVCPSAYLLCPNGISCAKTIDECTPLNSTCDGIICSNGSCVTDASECPTQQVCLGTQVLCLTDYSCQDSIDKCPTQSICPSTMVRCSSGSCVNKFDDCPSSIVCPIGFGMSESKACVLTSPVPGVTCNVSEIRCPDGSCAQNYFMCSSQYTCPTDRPVMCSDRNCVTSVSECNQVFECHLDPKKPDPKIQVCPDGSCVSGTRCPVVKTCPTTRPILCSNRTCVADRKECKSPRQCTSALPLRCASGDCRANIFDCPTILTCPITAPYRCSDDSCAIAPNRCVESIVDITTGIPTNKDQKDDDDEEDSEEQKYKDERNHPVLSCTDDYFSNYNVTKSDLITCPGGECAKSILLCPTHVTCPLGSVKCSDGRCALEKDCPVIIDNNLGCGENKITCPMASGGVSCASDIKECPGNIICPESRPVRCLDSSCATSISACPPLPIKNVEDPEDRNTKIPCSDGSWVVQNCPTSITCTKEAPYKCYDQSCRMNPFDCPTPPACPAKTPYLCPTGTCALFPWDCTTPAEGVCDELNPIKCPATDGQAECQPSLDHCKNRYREDADGTRNYCSGTAVYCRDGTCKDSASLCPLATCPPSLPYVCDDGMCAKSSTQCNRSNGCPFDKPVKCGNGACEKRFADCPIAVKECRNDKKLCVDGSCRRDCTDVSATGCYEGFYRCYDGSCVGSKNSCTSPSDSKNVCPGNTPVRCDNGLCVTSTSKCPVLDPSGTICTNPFKPILCGDGSCQENPILCRVIRQCVEGIETRCDDGTCGILDEPNSLNTSPENSDCPAINTCPKGYVRCGNGPCAINKESCYGEDGCPAGLVPCLDSGLCVTNNSDAAQLCNKTPVANGCSTDKPYKCWDGSCAEVHKDCRLSNGCPADNSIRCSSGKCVAKQSLCSTEEDPTCLVKCADGGCAANESECMTIFGCPVSTPIRCANGECAKYPATYRSPLYQLTPSQLALTCSSTILCPSESHVRCADGKCVASKGLCSAYTNPCRGNTPILCTTDNKTCVAENDIASCPSSCPSTSPVLCPNGGCVASALDCSLQNDPKNSHLAGSSSVKKCASTQITCFDGSCADSYLKCIEFANNIEKSDDTLPKCGTFCSDGSCLPTNNAALCPAISTCPVETYRCSDGTCVADIASCSNVTCTEAYHTRGVDGICRKIGTHPSYDGCHWSPSISFTCLNRECAENAAACESAARRDADVWARTLFDDSKAYKAAVDAAKASQIITTPSQKLINALASTRMKLSITTTTTTSASTSSIFAVTYREILQDPSILLLAAEEEKAHPLACEDDCLNQIKLNTTSILYSPANSVTLPLGPLSTRLSVTIPSGIVVNQLQGGHTIYFQPVAESIVVNATNRVHYSRISGPENYPSTLTYAQTVLSPLMSCYTESGIIQPFASRIELSSNIYLHSGLKYSDVCLARLRRFNNIESPYSTWDCVYSTAERIAGATVKPDPNILPGLVSSTIEYCNDPDAINEFAIYAFILNPLTSRQVYKQSLDTFFRDNMIWILLGSCAGLLLIAVIMYSFQRLARFKGKTVQIKDDVKRMENEVDEMEQFGGKAGTKDEEIMTQHNPLAVQLADMQKLTDENHLKLQQEKIAQQQAESAERTHLINQLEEESKRNLEALEQMKKRLHDSTQAHRVQDGPATLTMVASPSNASNFASPQAQPQLQPQSQPQSQRAPMTDMSMTNHKRREDM